MEFILLIILSVFIGYVFGIMRTIRHLKNMVDDHDFGNVKNLQKQQIPLLTTEKHGDTLYLFEKETDSFMCQGSSLEDLAKKLAEWLIYSQI